MIFDDKNKDEKFNRLFMCLLDAQLRPKDPVLADLMLYGGIDAIEGDPESAFDAVVGIDAALGKMGILPGGIS